MHLALGFLLHEHLQDTVLVGVVAEWTVRAARWYRRRHAGKRVTAYEPPAPPLPNPQVRNTCSYVSSLRREAQRRGMRA